MADQVNTPQFVRPPVSSICSLMARPLILTGLFRDVLIRHFQAATIEEHSLRHLIWRPGEGSPILVESVHRWTPLSTSRRPGVIVKRNAMYNRRVGVADRMQMNPLDREGHQHFETFWLGSHTLLCIGGSGARTELLGTEVQREFTQFGPLIRETMGLFRFQVAQVGAVAKLAEAKGNFVVPVTVSYAYNEKWTLVQQAPRLHRVLLSTILDC